jgi:hypothetical protein
MDSLEQRILALELQAKHERELTDFRLDDLSRRLQAMEKPKSLPVGSIGKIALALALPLVVLLGTGDMRKVLAVLRLIIGG